MKSIIISVGNEITSGHTVNTNAVWMAKTLTPYGLSPDKVIALRDDVKTLVTEIRAAIKKYELVLITGGLGPTHDDVTKPALVKVFKTRLVRDPKILGMVKLFFKERVNKPMPSINEGQADVPEGCDVIPNKWGTAPGLCFKTERGMLFALPGVPYEMKRLMEEEVIPRVKKSFAFTGAIATQTIHTIGIGESGIYEIIENSNMPYDDVELAYLPHMGQVDLRLTAKGATALKAKAKLNLAVENIEKIVGSYCYGKDDDTLEGIVGKILIEKEMTLASAESCTGGLFASRITSVPGSSEYFIEGVVTYDNDSKMRRLDVDEDTLLKYGAVSAQTAARMAKGVCHTSGADIGVSSTGIAGPGGGTEEKPVGLVYIGLCIKGNVDTKVFQLKEDRTRNQERTVHAMLTWLWREILKL